jgi:hypothetical protein
MFVPRLERDLGAVGASGITWTSRSPGPPYLNGVFILVAVSELAAAA